MCAACYFCQYDMLATVPSADAPLTLTSREEGGSRSRTNRGAAPHPCACQHPNPCHEHVVMNTSYEISPALFRRGALVPFLIYACTHTDDVRLPLSNSIGKATHTSCPTHTSNVKTTRNSPLRHETHTCPVTGHNTFTSTMTRC